MTDHSFPLGYASAYVKRYPENVTSREPRVRVYRSSPDRVTLQIRTGASSFATANLPFDTAIAIAFALREEANR